MEIVIIVMFIMFAVLISIIQIDKHKKRINEKIHLIGGEVISIERKIFYTGPFLRVRRGRTVYKIKYRLGNEIKEGWVKFGDLLGPDWKL